MSKHEFKDENEYYTSEYLKINRRKIKPKFINAMDTEDNTRGGLLYIVHFDGEKMHDFIEPYEYMKFLYTLSRKCRKGVYIACVNLEYDIVNAFKGFMDFLEFNYGNNLIYCKLKKTKINFYDTLNHYKMGVAKQGKILGIEKLKYDFTDKDALIHNDELLTYCKRDVEITYKFAVKYQKVLNSLGANMRFTIASSTLDMYTRNFLPFNLHRISDDYLKKIRRAYYGGRTEIFKMRG